MAVRQPDSADATRTAANAFADLNAFMPRIILKTPAKVNVKKRELAALGVGSRNKPLLAKEGGDLWIAAAELS